METSHLSFDTWRCRTHHAVAPMNLEGTLKVFERKRTSRRLQRKVRDEKEKRRRRSSSSDTESFLLQGKTRSQENRLEVRVRQNFVQEK